MANAENGSKAQSGFLALSRSPAQEKAVSAERQLKTNGYISSSLKVWVKRPPSDEITETTMDFSVRLIRNAVCIGTLMVWCFRKYDTIIEPGPFFDCDIREAAVQT